MLFHFLKYLQSTHYFQLYNKAGKSIFPKIELLPKHIIDKLETDLFYDNVVAIDYDLSWQAIQRGYIGDVATYSKFEELSAYDNYRFIRKNFHKAWVYYVFFLRLISFKPTLLEIRSFLRSRNVERKEISKNPIIYPDFVDYNSELIARSPLVSVIIPTLNRYAYLKDVLEDLEQQDYIHFEVLVIDQSSPFREEFYRNFNLNLQIIQQTEKALWLARNTAISISKGDYILLFDDDSRVKTDWIRQHLKSLDFFNSELSSGVSISTVGAKVPENYSYFRISDQLDTGNVLLRKEVFKKIGLFDRQFEKQRMGDGEFGLRAYLNGFLNISNPYAERLHLKATEGGLREIGSWDALRPKKWFEPRPIPSVLYFFRRYYGDKSTRLSLLKMMPASIMPYRFKRSRSMMLLGSIFSILISPVILIQVYKSWKLATDKVKQGPLIETLD